MFLDERERLAVVLHFVAPYIKSEQLFVVLQGGVMG